MTTAAGVPPIGLHGARHSYAMLALGAGARLDVVSRQLGHATAGFTATFYTHDEDEAAAHAADLVAVVLDG
jgi:integrase